MSLPIKIYSDTFTERHRFVFDLVFDLLLGIPYERSSADTCDINYSKTESKGLAIIPAGLLDKQGVDPDLHKTLAFAYKNEVPMLFSNDSSIGFDIFSACFYLVSRHEEYAIKERDAHQRFSADLSILSKAKLLDRPLVNEWALLLRDLLSYSDLTFKPRAFEYISTIDVDQAWKFKHKGFSRTIGAFCTDLFHGKIENFVHRFPVLFGAKQDPFNNFDWQHSVHKQYGIKTLYFWLLGKRSEFDKNIDRDNAEQQQLIRSIDEQEHCSVGIHPSYASNSELEAVQQEMNALAKATGQQATKSRQHFLLHQMPDTYRNLEQLGIREEHTMGYSTHFGFRAGIAAPFYFYDVEEDEYTEMLLYPFCMMDITPLHYMELSPEKGLVEIKKMIDKTHAVGGLCVTLWHNESMSETERWKGWRRVYEEMLSYIQLKGQ